MNKLIRKANAQDAEAMLHIKNCLPLKKTDGSSTKGGFLLGTNKEQYLKYIEESHCLVAEENNKVVGFGIVLKDQHLKTSDIWLRRKNAKWNIDIENYENINLNYFEQLAFLPGYRTLVVLLAYKLILNSINEGAKYIFATTVHKPILNLAAIPFILSVKGKWVGQIDEFYPIVGEILSDIYLIDLNYFNEEVKNHTLYPFIQKNKNLL